MKWLPPALLIVMASWAAPLAAADGFGLKYGSLSVPHSTAPARQYGLVFDWRGSDGKSAFEFELHSTATRGEIGDLATYSAAQLGLYETTKSSGRYRMKAKGGLTVTRFSDYDDDDTELRFAYGVGIGTDAIEIEWTRSGFGDPIDLLSVSLKF